MHRTYFARIILFLALFISLSLGETIATQPAGWTNGSGGTINTLSELRWLSETPLAWDEDWALGAHIDASDTETWNDSKGFSPIGNTDTVFSGSFDGQHHIISSLFFNRPGQSSGTGLIGRMDNGQISNIGLENVEFTSDGNTGAIVGFALNSSIINSYSTGTIITRLGNAGGIAGHFEGSISQCHAMVNLDGESIIGGLIGTAFQGGLQVTQSYSDGIVKGFSKIGGLVGEIDNTHGINSLTNSFSSTQVLTDFTDPSSKPLAGGIIGIHKYSYDVQQELPVFNDNYAIGKVTDNFDVPIGAFAGRLENARSESNYFDSVTTTLSVGIDSVDLDHEFDPDTVPQVAYGLHTDDFAESRNFPGWDFTHTWEINVVTEIDPNPRPYLKWMRITKYFPQEGGTIENSIIVNGTRYFSHATNPGFPTKPVTAIPFEGYRFSHWDYNGTSPLDSTPTITFESARDLNVRAFFKILTFDIQVSVLDSGGSLSGTLNQTVEYNQSLSPITYTLEEGFHFSHWQSSTGDTVSLQDTLTLDNITENLSISAVFLPNRYEVYFSVKDTGGSIEGDTLQNINHNNTSTPVIAKPNIGFEFSHWQNSNDSILSQKDTLSLSNIIKPESVFAVFHTQSFNITFNSSENGSLEGPREQVIFYDQPSTKIMAIPDSGFHFSHWIHTNSQDEFSTANPLVIPDVQMNYSLSPVFEPIPTFSITVEPHQNATIRGASQTVFLGQRSDSITIEPHSGFQFLEWRNLEDSLVSTDNPLIIDSIQRDYSLKAIVVDTARQKLIFQTSTGGHLLGDTIQYVGYNTIGTSITAVPDSGFHFAHWQNANGDSLFASNPLLIEEKMSDSIVIASFQKNTEQLNKPHLVRFKTSKGGSLIGDTLQWVENNKETQLIIARPDYGYEFLSWQTSSRTNFSTSDSLVIPNVLDSNSYTAIFAPLTFSITGTSTGSRVLSIPHPELSFGDSLEITLTPLKHHYIDYLKQNELDITDQLIENEGTFKYSTFVVEDLHFIAVFKAKVNAPIISNESNWIEVTLNSNHKILKIVSTISSTLKMYNVSGKPITSHSLKTNKEWTINYKGWKTGSYFIAIENEYGLTVRPIHIGE